MKSSKKPFWAIFELAVQLSAVTESDALLIIPDGSAELEQWKERAGETRLLVGASSDEQMTLAKELGIHAVRLDEEDNVPVFEKLTQALLESVADDILTPGARVVALYSGFEPGVIDSISYLRLDDHLGKLTGRDLRRLETSVPLDVLKLVLDLAVDIGREGREGKPVGTMFVVGDTRKVLSLSYPAGFDPVRGYSRKERDLRDPRVREALKEIALLDGAFIITAEGVVEKSCRLVDTAHANVTLSKGLGARHWAGAAISRTTNAIAVVVSESSGTVRLFGNGETILRVEPFRRAMKWKDFEYEPPSSGD